MRKHIQIIIISIALIILANLAGAQNKVMTFSTHVQEGTIVFNTTFHIMQEAFKRIGYDFVLKTYPGKRALWMSNEGKTDGEAHRIYGITDNGKYPNLVRIPEIQQVIYDYAYTTKKIKLDNGWEDLASYQVAVKRGAVYITEMSQKHAKKTYELATTLQLFKFLKSGRADIVITNPTAANKVLEMKEFQDIRKIAPPLTTLPIYAYLHKKHKNLAPKVATAIYEMKEDGTYQRIIRSIYNK